MFWFKVLGFITLTMQWWAETTLYVPDARHDGLEHMNAFFYYFILSWKCILLCKSILTVLINPPPQQCDRYAKAIAAARASCEVCSGSNEEAAAAKADDGGCEHESVPKSLCRKHIGRQKCDLGNSCRDAVQHGREFSPLQ